MICNWIKKTSHHTKINILWQGIAAVNSGLILLLKFWFSMRYDKMSSTKISYTINIVWPIMELLRIFNLLFIQWQVWTLSLNPEIFYNIFSWQLYSYQTLSRQKHYFVVVIEKSCVRNDVINNCLSTSNLKHIMRNILF